MNYCERCSKQTLHIEQAPNHILHLLLSLVTAGLWIIIWIVVSVASKKVNCTICGNDLKHSSNKLSGSEALAAYKKQKEKG